MLDNFVFKLVPMINADGVYHGHYRTSIFNENLNRVYKTPSILRSPEVYGIKKMMQVYKKAGKLFFYVDLHAHGVYKGCFVFGNFHHDFAKQIETQTYAKVLELNSMNFQNDYCKFSK